VFRKYLTILIILFFANDVRASQNFAPANIKPENELVCDILIEPPLAQLAEYEKMTYTVKWLGVPVGIITASIKGLHEINNRQAYMLEVTAKTNALCSAIYKIDDRFISYMDAENFYTLRHEVYRREGRYKKDAVTDFDHTKKTAYFRNLLDNSDKAFGIPYGVQDTLSACYYFRLLKAEIGKKVEYSVCNNEAVYQLFGVIDTIDYINLPKIGKKPAFHIQPYAQIKGEEVKKGRVSGYFSADSKRMPILAVVQAPMFTEITAVVNSIEYGQNE